MDGNLNTEYSVEYQYCPGCSGSRTARIKRDGDGEILSWYRYEEQGINTLRVDEKYDSDSSQCIDEDDEWRVQRYAKATKEIVLAYPHGETGIPSATDELVYATDRAGTVFHAFDDTGLLVYGSITEQDSFGAEMNGSWGHSSVTKHNWGCEYDSDVALYYFGGKRSWFSPERGMYLQHGSGYGIPGSNPPISGGLHLGLQFEIMSEGCGVSDPSPIRPRADAKEPNIQALGRETFSPPPLVGNRAFYGNWCGGGMSGGRCDGKIGKEPPCDKMDTCCQEHDYCYAADKKTKKECDKDICDCLGKLTFDDLSAGMSACACANQKNGGNKNAGDMFSNMNRIFRCKLELPMPR